MTVPDVLTLQVKVVVDPQKKGRSMDTAIIVALIAAGATILTAIVGVVAKGKAGRSSGGNTVGMSRQVVTL